MNPVETILLNNINKPNVLFVFPTDIAVSRWADHTLRCLNGGTIAMDKFIAWDKFKQKSIKSKVQNKKSIPSVLRKIFVGRLVNENSEAVKQNKTPIFSSLISVKWAEQSVQFVPWLTDILPQLGIWFKRSTGLSIDNILSAEADKIASKFKDDNKDMYALSCRYATFLEAHLLFEPAWETPPFNNDGLDCFIFFPEALNDFCEYEELLSASSHVKIIYTSQIESENTEKKNCDTFFYTNSRSEITEAALYIRALHEKQEITWDSIAVCIADPENYEPYVLREFTNRNIPFVKRTSKPLTDYPAGRFFQSVLDCASLNYSFSSLVSLIRNKSLPWKETELIDQLIQFGIKNNCLYSWTENEKQINIWEDAFENPLDDPGIKVKEFFNELKKHLHILRSSCSFTELRRQYFNFREHFLDIDKYTKENNLIMSRCIAELAELTNIEKDFPDIQAVDAFAFFTEHLNEVNYLAQSKSCGVAILPYKTAASAPFDCHIVLGANQDVLSVVYTRLAFLPRKKREELGIIDKDASAFYINLHKYNSIKKAAFFCCEQTFSGFAIPHSKIDAPSDPKEQYAADTDHKNKFSCDYYKEENIFCSSIAGYDKLTKEINLINLHENQIKGFTEWKERRKQSAEQERKMENYEEVKNHILSIFAKAGKPGISPSALQSYYSCSLSWLFKWVFDLRNTRIETTLMDDISGSVYHAVLNQFFSMLKNKNEPLLEPVHNEDDPDAGLVLPSCYQELLENSIEAVFEKFPLLEGSKKAKMSSLTTRLLRARKMDYQYRLGNSIACFLSFFAGCRVVDCEKYYQTEKDSYILKGYIDFILKDPSDKYIIVDFKLKYMPDRGDCTGEGENGLINFQLPAYITLTEENENFKVYTALFYSLLDISAEVIIGTICDINTEKIIPNEEKQVIRDCDKYKLLFGEFKNKAEQFAQDITAGNFKALPKNDNNCYNCDYHRICRTVYVINRENINSLRKSK
jgi:hypothetical protein